jgi:hypothetical protein
MSSIEALASAGGGLIILVTAWQLLKRGLPRSDGSIDGVNKTDFTQGSDGH